MMGRPWQKCMTSLIHCWREERVQSGTVYGDGSRSTTYLLLYVVERVGAVDGEADQDDMAVGVRERAQAIVVLEGMSVQR